MSERTIFYILQMPRALPVDLPSLGVRIAARELEETSSKVPNVSATTKYTWFDPQGHNIVVETMISMLFRAVDKFDANIMALRIPLKSKKNIPILDLPM